MNAQDSYKTASLNVFVYPKDTKASVSRITGNVTATPLTDLESGTIIFVNGVNPADYTITIVHSDCFSASATASGTVFEFLSYIAGDNFFETVHLETNEDDGVGTVDRHQEKHISRIAQVYAEPLGVFSGGVIGQTRLEAKISGGAVAITTFPMARASASLTNSDVRLDGQKKGDLGEYSVSAAGLAYFLYPNVEINTWLENFSTGRYPQEYNCPVTFSADSNEKGSIHAYGGINGVTRTSYVILASKIYDLYLNISDSGWEIQ